MTTYYCEYNRQDPLPSRYYEDIFKVGYRDLNFKYVKFSGNSSIEEQIINHIIKRPLLLEIFGILGMAYRLGIYNKIKVILIMKGLNHICSECDRYITKLNSSKN